jgi:hypothetical protein
MYPLMGIGKLIRYDRSQKGDNCGMETGFPMSNPAVNGRVEL